MDKKTENSIKISSKNSIYTRFLTWIACIVISIAVILVILVTSCEVAIYGDMSYYETLYEKYEVADDLQMEMDDIVYVTQEMMSYLRGDRDDLIVDTVVDGVGREFFNESEISHMEDVQELFIGGLVLRRISIGVALALLIFLIILKTNWAYILPRAFQRTTIAFTIVVGWLGYLFATDFYKYFVIFHEIFFEDGTWTFDVNESLMINMLPEGLFYDFTARIVVVFLVMMVVVLVGTGICRKRMTRKDKTP